MRLIFILVFYSHLILAGTKEYIVGSGSEFKFVGNKGENVSLSIYISESSFNKLGIEYFFSVTNSFIPVQVWQQYQMGIKANGLSLDAGYVLFDDMKSPEIMTQEFMKNNPDGVDVTDFFFQKQIDIDKYKIRTEQIEVPAGTLQTTHYRKTRDKQTVDFWISDAAGAIGLVKLISKGQNADEHNYTIELMSLLKNVKPKIDPKNAVPLSDKGRRFLGKKK